MHVPPFDFLAWLPVLVSSPAAIRHAIILSAPGWRTMIFLLVRAWRVKAVIGMQRRRATRRAAQRNARRGKAVPAKCGTAFSKTA